MTNPYFLPLLKSHGIPEPTTEYRFAPPRRWRMDYAWPDAKLALEVQGGIWTRGRHSRPAALLKEWEKLNTGATMGYRFLFCQPADLLKPETINAIKAALSHDKAQNH